MKRTAISRIRRFGLCALAALATSIHTHAAVVVTEHGPFGEANGLDEAQMIALHPVGIGDLLESATGSFASGGPVFGGQLPTITDGLAVPTPGPFYASNGSQVEYQLGATIDLARIDFAMFADWQRTSAWVDVHTSTDGGSIWTLLHEVRVAESNVPASSDRQYNAASLTDTTGTLAAGINAIRFTFLGDGMGADESGYTEIDAYAVPEPATFSLAALGLLLLGRRRRR
jgi:hypothetical protein